jgi:hypothetical protein
MRTLPIGSLIKGLSAPIARRGVPEAHGVAQAGPDLPDRSTGTRGIARY